LNYTELSRIFVELPSFMARWKSLGLTDDDLLRLELELDLEKGGWKHV